MIATIAPANASNQNVTWSIVPGTGTASISATGMVTAQTNGTVFAKAVSVANANAKDSLQITITNQVATAIVNPIFEQLVVYPNPAQNELIVKLLKNHPPLQMQMVNAVGQLVSETSLPANRLRQLYRIDISRLAKGSYLLILNSEGKPTVIQVIKN
jgi:uncharacterized protein YjdB